MRTNRTGLRFKSTCLLPIIALVAIVAISATAQTTSGSIYGTISDQGGSVIPNATVTVKNNATGETRTVVSNGAGNYLFPALQPGNYTVTAHEKGFQTETQNGVQLAVAQNVQASFKLPVGSQNQTITVSATTTLVDTRESQLGETVGRVRIRDLPLNGRNAYDLVQLVPGVTNYKAAAAGGDNAGTTFTVNGNRPLDNSYYLDGVFDSVIYRNGGAVLPNPDALDQFRLLTSNFDAEFGREPGGVVNVITRSGTNQYHGVMWDYLRNDVLNAKNYFLTGVTPLRQNQFGVATGGPIARNKTFIFGSYEGLRVRTPAIIASSALVTPTPAETRGDFSAEPSKRWPKQPNGKPYSCNGIEGAICPNLLDPVALNLLKYVPLSNPVTGRPPEQSAPANINADQYLVRVDNQLTGKHRLSGMFFTSRATTEAPNIGKNQILDFSGASHYENQTNAVVSDAWIISPVMLNSLRLFYSLNHYVTRDVFPSTWSDYGSPIKQGGPQTSQPLITVNGYWTMGMAGNGPNNQSMRQLGAMDTFNWTHGNHEIKMGGSFIWNWYAETGAFLDSGKLAFTGFATGNPLADFLLGRASTLEQNTGVFHRLHAPDPALFVQDDWRATHRLTLDLGLRWELYPPYTGQNDMGTFVPNVQSKRFPTAPLGLLSSGDSGVPDGVRITSWKTFAPRFGFAYDLFGNGATAIRGAYGIFYSAEEETLTGNLEQQPFLLDVIANDTPNLSTPYAPNPDPFPYTVSKPTFTSGATIIGLPPHSNAVPYVQEYNLSLQQQLATQWSMQIAYVGSVSRKFYLLRDENSPVYVPGAKTTTAGLNARRPYEPTPATYVFGAIHEVDPAANASYNSLQATLTRRFAHSFSLLASYVWSRNIDFVSNDPNTVPQLVNENDIGMEKGLADYAVPQRFVASYIWAAPTIHRGGFVGRQILSGWQLNGITTLMSGTPFTVTSGRDSNLDGITNDRPNQVENPILPGGRSRGQKINMFFNTAAFAQLPAGVPYGDVRRSSLLGPGTVNTDFSAFKNFHVTRESMLQFRAEIFNLFNNVNLNNPNALMTSKKYGQITGAKAPRIVQFALRYSF